jgi:hypothetical protein
MYSDRGDAALPAPGFPIRESAGQRLFSTSPRLIAAVHALHRLLVPRHPPCALTILTVIRVPKDPVISPRVPDKGTRFCLANKCGFQGPGRAQPGGLPGRSLKTQQHRARPPLGQAAGLPAARLRASAPASRSGRHIQAPGTRSRAGRLL